MSYQWGPMREPTGQFEVVASCGNDLLHGARGRVTGGVGCVSGEFSPPAHRPHAASAPSGSGEPPANSSRGSTQLGGHTMSYQWGPMREPTGQFEVVASCGNDLLHGARGRVTGGVGCVSGEFSPPAHRPHAASAHARCRDAPIHSKLRAFAATSIHIDIGSGKYILQWRCHDRCNDGDKETATITSCCKWCHSHF